MQNITVTVISTNTTPGRCILSTPSATRLTLILSQFMVYLSGMKSSELKKTISKKLTEQGLSIRELERRAGLAQSCINNIMLGRTKSPTLEIAGAIAKELNCTLDELLGTPPPKKVPFIWNSKLYTLSSSYVAEFLNKSPVPPTCLEEILNCTKEIYNYCAMKNNYKFDKKFAEWSCEKSF